MTAFDLDLTRPMLAYASAYLSTGGIPTMTSSWPAAAHAWLQEIRAALARLLAGRELLGERLRASGAVVLNCLGFVLGDAGHRHRRGRRNCKSD